MDDSLAREHRCRAFRKADEAVSCFTHLRVRDKLSESADAADPVLGDIAPPEETAPLRERSILEDILAFLDDRAAAQWAAALIHEFGSLGVVMAQSEHALLRALRSAEAASFVQAVRNFTAEWLRIGVNEAPLLHRHDALLAYLRCRHAFAADECLRVLFLDAQNKLLKDELLFRGTLNECPLWPRPILRRCLEVNAASLILVHNHPSGDHKPSGLDIEATARFCATAKDLGIRLHDHLIVSSRGHTSLRALGLL
jgi:DNA repair protein RadC